MKKYRNWFFAALAVIVCAVGCLGLVNYTVDPYGIFRRDFSNQFIIPNQHFIKPRHIVENPDKYNCFIMGSSRVNGIEPASIKDASCYNMTLAGGIPSEYLDNLRYLLKKGIKIKLLLLGLDEFSFVPPANIYLEQPLRYPYPPVINERILPYYLKYLFSLFTQKTWETVWAGYKKKLKGNPEDVVRYDMFGSGITYAPGLEEKIEKDPEAHAKDPQLLVYRSVHVKFRNKNDNMEETVRVIKNIAGIAQEHNIRLVIFINPGYYGMYLHNTDHEKFAVFKKELAKISDFYDFSGLNSITTNPYYYYEGTHYRQKMGNIMIARIFGNDTVQVPADFGFLATKSNVDAHNKTLQKQLEEYIKEK